MANTLRTIVSGDKRRYTEGGYNLDLTYITPRLIAMGLPGKGVSTLWRNRVEEVASFLEQNHSGHYKIFSLGKSATDFFRLRNNTSWFGWSSKKSPPLELLHKILLAINDWLALNPLNVAVIHCKEGRERSGVVIAAYLVKSGIFSTPKEALDYYATMRSRYQEGVQTPSQIRYVHYITSVQQPPAPRKIFLRRITMRPVPDYSTVTPIVEIINSGVVPTQTLLTLKNFRTYQKLDFTIPLDLSYPIQGDTYIRVSNRMNLLGLKANVLMFRVGFHTSFVPNRWVLTKADLDGELAGPVRDDKIRKGFTVEFMFTDGPFDPLPVDPMAVPQTTSQSYSQHPTQYQTQSSQYQQMTSMQSQYPQVSQYAQVSQYPQPTQAPQVVQVPQVPVVAQQTVSSSGYTVVPQRDVHSSESYFDTTSQDPTLSSFGGTASSWYHPSMNPTMSTMPSIPPAVNRDTKDNRQALNQATDAVARATERLMTMGTMNSTMKAENPNQEPMQKINL